MDGAELDLEAYFARVAYSGGTAPTIDTLRALHLAHATHVPFENADIQLGRPIKLDLASLQEKIVRGRRGGYCFEQNTLFAAVLERLGFAVTTLAARVVVGRTGITPRTHMLMRVDVAGQGYLADVGFGAAGVLLPIPLEPERIAEQFAWSYRLARDGGTWTLATREGDAWVALYTFTLERHYPIDYEVANHYTSTHPASRFVTTLTAQRIERDVRHVLRNAEYEEVRPTERRTRVVTTNAELVELLAERFGVALPAGTRFRAPVLP